MKPDYPQESRIFDPAEHYFWLLDQSACMNFVVFAELEEQFSLSAWQSALNSLSQRIALLRTGFRISTGGSLQAEVQPQSVITVSCHEVAAADWLTPIEAELKRPFDAHESSVVRCLYLRLQHSSQSVIALTFHHSLADGRTGVAVLGQLIASLFETAHYPSDHPPDHPNNHLAPGLHALFPPHYDWESHPETFRQLAALRRDELKRHGKPHKLSGFRTDTTAIRQPKIMRIELTESETTALAMKSKAEQCTVHGALAAAELLALYTVTTNGQDTNDHPLTLSLTTPADLRTHLASTLDRPARGLLGLYITMLSANYPLSENTGFWQLAREVSADIQRTLQRGDGHILYHQFQPGKYSPADQAAVKIFSEAAGNAHQSALLSNLGMIAPLEGPVGDSVRSLSFALCPMPSQTVFVAAGTYRQRLFINLNFDLGRMPAALARQIADLMQQRLLDECINSQSKGQYHE